MRRITIVGLSLVTMLAFSAMVASVAQAAEVAACTKAGKILVTFEKEIVTTTGEHRWLQKEKAVHDGEYTEKNCLTVATAPGAWDKESPPKVENTSYKGREGKYEWGAAGFKFTSRSGPTHPHTKLEMSGGRIVECASSVSTGEWTGPKTGVETILFKGCKLYPGLAKCTSGQAGLNAGEIETSALHLTLIGYPEELLQIYWNQALETTSVPTGPFEGEAWVESSTEGGQPYAEYACGPEASFRTLGTVAGRILTKVNMMERLTTTWTGPGLYLQDLYSEYSENGGPYVLVGATAESSERTQHDLGAFEIKP